MPTYDYKCNDCGEVLEVTHSIKETPEYHCNKCDSKDPLERIISHNIAGFTFKQGTVSMAYKEERIRHKKNAGLEVRQMEKWTPKNPTLSPNIGGTPFESWGDASKAAKEAGLDTSGYKAMAEKEKHTDKKSGIDNRKWKAVKEKAEKS